MEMRHSILPSAPHLDFSNTIDSADMFLSLPLRVEELLLFFTASSYAFISSSQIRTHKIDPPPVMTAYWSTVYAVLTTFLVTSLIY
jgi:hypothetical protein